MASPACLAFEAKEPPVDPVLVAAADAVDAFGLAAAFGSYVFIVTGGLTTGDFTGAYGFPAACGCFTAGDFAAGLTPELKEDVRGLLENEDAVFG